jgi:hypothetical protein
LPKRFKFSECGIAMKAVPATNALIWLGNRKQRKLSAGRAPNPASGDGQSHAFSAPPINTAPRNKYTARESKVMVPQGPERPHGT